MRIFVTGASGWIGSAAVRELLAAGHQVVGLARSEESAAAVTALGAEVHRGSLDDLDSLVAGATGADGVLHLGYNHDFSQMEAAAGTDRAALEAMGGALEPGGFLLFAAGTMGVNPGSLATEDDVPAPGGHARSANAETAHALIERGIRSVGLRFAPTVHGEGDHGFIATIVDIARTTGVSAYVGDGSNRWPAVHRLDAGALIARAVLDAPAGSMLHVIAEQGIPARTIAETIGRKLDLPVTSVAAADAAEHFGWMGMFFSMDAPASNEKTRALLDWNPTHATLLEDLEAGHYTD
ncbi:MAG TPA: SDR family oxidoreductase [Marmoricola sp.]|jgi:nucleoside-diphosphate-sugar epimerase|nr:SDR family oxidoreductase [Marmoricola sp.]